MPIALLAAALLFAAPAPEKAPPPAATAHEAGYDPLRTAGGEPKVVDLEVQDAARGRVIPIRVYLPEAASPQPVILYSHGLGGSRATSEYLGRHWARRGYVAVFLQHPGSDSAVWQGEPGDEARAALAEAANVEQLVARVRDVPAVLDALTRWNAERGHALQAA